MRFTAYLPAHDGDPRRAIVTPPRPRAKCGGFYAPLREWLKPRHCWAGWRF
ncbi:hypothetical protein ACM25P_03190 [Vreelandella alkaliphila]|uniref:hypothetical protein n=1 Tax=Vreelandella alkaliphila TaxID=272774 RepID=UPI0039F63127